MFALYQLLINERFHLHTVTSGSFPAYSIVRKQKHGRRNPVMFLFCAPGGARFSRVQVPNPPGSGKDIAEGKGVHREVESEGSRIWGTY